MARPFVELYINDKKVFFKEPPEIFITYAHTDLHNPTVVKNSYTKTITVEGTPENNRIFNNFYDMRRINSDDLFNPSRKESFTLYRNGEPMESGYVKLDKVNKKEGRITYDITLYGGLGQFLYNLQYKEDGEKMKLSDLEYNTDFDFEINRNVVGDAWKHITGQGNVTNSERYDVINFAPCYNGIPENFSADKVAIDIDSLDWNADFADRVITQKDGYTTVNGWLLGELKKEYDEWQMSDLRSYLQRPVIRFKEIISACCNPNNNGGYLVNLDSDFFNEENPYYENAWMTLPLLSEIEVEDEAIATISENDGSYKINGIENGSYIKVTIPYSVGVIADSTASELKTTYTYSYASVGAGTFLQGFSDVVRYIQLVAIDSSGKIVGGSGIKSFHSTYSSDNSYKYEKEYNATVTDIIGTYKKQEDIYKFVSNNSDVFDFTIDKLKYTNGLTLKFVEKWLVVNDGTYRATTNTLFGKGEVTANEWILDVYTSNANIVKLLGQGKRITQTALLNSENTPCDYFLSYLKMFNLHIWKDMYDNIIYVKQRKNFFTGDVKDIDESIDRSGDIVIKPLTFENKWLNFKAEYEQDEKLHKDYLDNYGIDYGIQKVDTNYNFDSSSKDILENYVFKGCVTSRSRSKYYINLIEKTSDGNVYYPPFMLDGCQTLLFNADGDTTEGSYLTPKTSIVSNFWWKDKYYDLFPKPSFVNDKNEGVEGANVLLFYKDKVTLKDNANKSIFIYLTDDIPEFEQLNDGEPCWIWSTGSIAKDMNYLPVFSRYLTNENGWVTHSWDFGTPKALYIPDYSIDESSSLYSQYWKPYIRDQYDANTRVVECKVLLRERVIGDWLQNFYYWDGRYWVLNKIVDYNPASNGTTKCEFISVNDTNNYKS